MLAEKTARRFALKDGRDGLPNGQQPLWDVLLSFGFCEVEQQVGLEAHPNYLSWSADSISFSTSVVGPQSDVSKILGVEIS